MCLAGLMTDTGSIAVKHRRSIIGLEEPTSETGLIQTLETESIQSLNKQQQLAIEK